VTVTADGGALSPFDSKPGKVVFDVPIGTSNVNLQVTFTSQLGGVSSTVLQADQAYTMNGTVLQVDPTPFSLQNGQLVSQNVHPLIDSVSGGNAAFGITLAEVRTEFVDVTQIWRAVSQPSSVREFDAEHETLGTLVAIGATGASPPLWFVSFASGLEPPSPDVSCLVFFRPALHYTYATVDDPRHGNNNGMFNVNRFLLAPRNPDQPIFTQGEFRSRPNWTWNRFARPTGDDDFIWLRASFERALLNSGLPLVMVHPFPTDGLNFGAAQTADLPKALAGIIRMLRGLGFCASTQEKVTLGRLGLAGYSAGGSGVFASLKANRQIVKELYLFDCQETATNAPFVIQWARSTSDFRLRMTGSNQWASNTSIKNSVVDFLGSDDGITASPDSLNFWNPASQGGSPWWDFVLKDTANLRFNGDARHQFVLFGGNSFSLDPNSPEPVTTTYLEEFLSGSGF